MDDLIALGQQFGPTALFIGLMVLMHVFGHGGHGGREGHQTRRTGGPVDETGRDSGVGA